MKAYTRLSLRLLCAVIILTLSLALASCDVIAGFFPSDEPECTAHTDADGNLLCDVCGDKIAPAAPEHTAHEDTDGDGCCDECGAKLEPDAPEHTAHTDLDSDYYCDECGAQLPRPCDEHIDGNCDGKCDNCLTAMNIPHWDMNGDGVCDRCGGCVTHIDENCDAKCDRCEIDVTVVHADKDEDGKCDRCETCLTHTDLDCNDNCDHCGAAMSEGHRDLDEDGWCDKCRAHILHEDGNCDAKCDRCEIPMPIIHKDADGNNLCDGCGELVLPISFTAKKTASISGGASAYPAYYIAWSDTTYRGSYITYTITVENTGNSTAPIVISDKVPAGTAYISGCEDRIDNSLYWTLSIPAGESASVSYTVAVSLALNGEAAVIPDRGATVGDLTVSSHDIYVANTLNEVDIKYIEKAVRILADSTYTALDFAKFAYTVAFSNAKAITELMSGSPSEILDLILSGSDDKLVRAIAPGLYGGEGVEDIFAAKGDVNSPMSAADLMSGDIAFVKTGDTVRMYIVCGQYAYDITNTATKIDISALVTAIDGASKYAVLRPSFTMSGFTPADPDEAPEQMNAYQEALVKTAEAYLMRGEKLQYEDVYFGLISQSGEYRWTQGEKSPEEYTSDEWGYVNCAVFTYDVYFAAFGYSLPSKMYTTANLTAYADTNGMSVFRFERTRADVYTEAEQLAIEAEFMATLQVGDIMVRRHTNVSTGSTTGHAMLYVGNGRFIHSSGSSYSTSSGTGYEIYEPTIRCHKVHDYLFGSASTSMFNDEDNIITIVRPFNGFSGEIPENTLSRGEAMDGVTAEKISSAPSSVTVNPGDLITFTFVVRGIGEGEKTIDIYDKIPAGCIYVSGGDRIEGDELYWSITVGCGDVVSVSYTVRVGDVADGTLIDGTDATVGGVSHRCAATRVKNTLTESEQNAIIAAIDELRAEGTTLGGLALVNEIYKRALGIDVIFKDTNADNVMRDGTESVFAQSSKKNNGKYCSKLQETETYYSSMLVDHLYGGMRFDSSAKLRDRTRLLKEHNLVVGDILIGRTSSSVNIYIWAGDAGLILLNSGIGNAVDFVTISERIMYFGRDFAVLRPSFVRADSVQ